MILLILLFIFLSIPTAHGVTRYVAPASSGGDDNRSCGQATDQGTPLETASVGLGCTNASDTLVFRSGTYVHQPCITQSNLASGSAGFPTRFIGFPGETVWFRDIDGPGACGGEALIALGHMSYIEFDNINLNGVDGHGTCVQMAGTAVTETTLTTHVDFRNMMLRYCGIGMQGGDAWINLYNIDVGYGCRHESNPSVDVCPEDTGFIEGHGLYLTGNNGTYEKLQLIDNRSIGITLSCEDACNPNVHSNWMINVIASGQQTGIFALPGNTTWNCLVYDNVTGILSLGNIYNCTAYGNSSGGIAYDYNSQILRNNISMGHGSGANMFCRGGCQPANSDHNICDTSDADCNILSSTSIFANVGARDFYPSSAGATMVDFGNNSVPNVPSTDVTGTTPRVVNGTIDIGAYEFTTGGGVVGTELRFGVQPESGTQIGVIISPPITVNVTDSNGNIDTLSSALVNMNIGTNPGGSVLGGDPSKNASSGTATFNDLTLSVSGNHTLIASSTGLGQVISNMFSIAPLPIPAEVLYYGNPRGVGFSRR